MKRPNKQQVAINHEKGVLAGLRGNQLTICEATGITDNTQLEKIEDCMRHTIFHSTLDWQTTEQLHKAAIESIEVLEAVKQIHSQQAKM